MLAALSRRPSSRRTFFLGLFTGLIYFAGTLYWTGTVVRVYGGLNTVLAALVAAALVAFLSLYVALFAVVTGRLFSSIGAAPALAAAPLVWVTSEYARAYLFTGFPWVLLGYSQVTVLPIAQLASLVGVFGLSGFVASVNAALALVVAGSGWRKRVAGVVAAVASVAIVATWGQARISGGSLAIGTDSIRVGIIQGNVPQDEKWDPARASEILGRYLRLSREAAASGAQLLVWPESSTPFFLEEDPVGRAAIADLAVETGTYILIGSDQVERGSPARYYNAAFLVGPDGRTLDVYRKMHLVPFGEYVPLADLLFFVSPLVEAVSDFTPGDEATVMRVGRGSLSTAICYEVVYPDLVRQFVTGGAELLTTITNDAWYGYSSAPYQHFEQAVMRAIEQGRYLVRSANTGISAIVDPYGRILQRSGLFETVTLTGEVSFLDGTTFYGRTGDLVAWAAILFTALSVAVTLTVRRPSRSPRRTR